MADVSVAPEEIRIGERAVVVEHFFTLADLTQRGDSQDIIGVINVCLGDG